VPLTLLQFVDIIAASIDEFFGRSPGSDSLGAR